MCAFFGRGHYEEHFCEIILNLDQWFRRFRLKELIPRDLAVFLFDGAKPFVQF